MKPSDGYFLAKKHVQELLDGRLGVLHSEAKKQKDLGNRDRFQELTMEMDITEKIRTQIRNSLLWDTSWDKIKE